MRVFRFRATSRLNFFHTAFALLPDYTCKRTAFKIYCLTPYVWENSLSSGPKEMSEEPPEPEEMSEEEVIAYAAEIKGAMEHRRKEEKRSLLVGSIINSVRLALCFWGAYLAAKWLVSHNWASWWLFPFAMVGALFVLLALTMLLAELVGKQEGRRKSPQPNEQE